MLLFGNKENNSVMITNDKIMDIQNNVELNATYRIKPTWMEQGEELGVFNCCLGNVVCLFNRPIGFASDIKFNSKLNDNSLYKIIECYIRARDVIGLIL